MADLGIDGLIGMAVVAFAIGLTGALTPGPTLVAAINSSLKNGWTAGPKVAAGHAIIELVLFLVIIEGLVAGALSYSGVIAAMGGIALIIFGFLTIKGSTSATLGIAEYGNAGNPYLAGVLTSAANPYFWIWWLSIGSAFVLDGLKAGLVAAGFFMIGHWGADFAWYTLVSSSMDRGRFILSTASYRMILALCGGFLVAFGIYYLTESNLYSWTP